jgi:hypothetical protein
VQFGGDQADGVGTAAVDEDDDNEEGGDIVRPNDNNDGETAAVEDQVDSTADRDRQLEVTSGPAFILPSGVVAVEKSRKGRNSVEEIVAEAVCMHVNAKACRMHPCGREDIDVRVLGNGRPFALEVLEPAERPTEAQLKSAVEYIAGGSGLNSRHDIEVLFLEVADRGLWEGMQVAAEEKDKAYRCVVYSEKPLTQSDIDRVESLAPASSPDVVLTILQKTPLRVLHRRSLLTRTRHIYQLQARMLNQHYMILSLVTSAGTYVKEFVHGDLGRTVPSISSVLGTHADILQLDVTWLFDEFRGGGRPTDPSFGRLFTMKSIDDVSSKKRDSDSNTFEGSSSLNDMNLIPLKRRRSSSV